MQCTGKYCRVRAPIMSMYNHPSTHFTFTLLTRACCALSLSLSLFSHVLGAGVAAFTWNCGISST